MKEHILKIFSILIVYYKIMFHFNTLMFICKICVLLSLTNAVTRNLRLMTILMELYVALIRDCIHTIARYLKLVVFFLFFFFKYVTAKKPINKEQPNKSNVCDGITILFSISKNNLPSTQLLNA